MMMRDMPIECCSMPMSPTVDSEKKDTHSTHTHIHHDNNGGQSGGIGRKNRQLDQLYGIK